MAANQRRRNAERGRGNAGAALKRRKNRRKVIIFAFEILLILAMLGVIGIVNKVLGGESGGSDSASGKNGLFGQITSIFSGEASKGGPKRTVIVKEDVIPEEIQAVKEQEESAMKGYWNIALFGMDATNEKEVEKNSRSDTIMIASINIDTGEIKLVSVYRDTYLDIGRDSEGAKETYSKCNAAYAKGGPARAIRMLNTNLDMDIEDFVTIGYNSLIDVIDGLGGVWVEIKENEISYLNDYQKSIVLQWKYGKASGPNGTITEDDLKKLKPNDYTPVKEAKYQLLNGLQAAAYCRIRYVGNDYARTVRQRTVLKAIQDQALKADLGQLADLFNKVVGQVYTSLEKEEMLEMLGMITKYKIVGESGFPTEGNFVTGNIGASGSCIVPRDLETNVVWLHKFLFGDETYTVTDGIRERDKIIRAKTQDYLGGQ